jgi:CRP-like cAMP-binding protein
MQQKYNIIIKNNTKNKKLEMINLDRVGIFDGIGQNEINKMLICFEPWRKIYGSKSTIMEYSTEFKKIGIIIKGSAELSSVDYDGRLSILQTFKEGDVFGEVFALPPYEHTFFVKADTKCEVMFIDYSHLIKRCSKACLHHSQLVDNLFHMSAITAQNTALHLNILSQRSIRNKLTEYFHYIYKEQNKNPFKIPFSLSMLSEYLCVDRASMMREIRKMNIEKLITSNGRLIENICLF